MSDAPSASVPAPAWRRLASIGYDAFLLAGIWMATTMAMTLAGQITPIANSAILRRIALFCAGFAFFGWFWTHGGQTLGMRAWRVRVERTSGGPLHASTALLRYMAGLLPAVVALFVIAQFGWIASPILAIGLLPCLFDPRRRALHDLIAGTQLVQIERDSAQGTQSQQGDQHEQHGRQAG